MENQDIYIAQGKYRLCFIYLYKHDLAIIGDRRDINEVFESVRREFIIKVEGGLNDFLGCEIIRDPEKKRCWILQNHLINKLIKKVYLLKLKI